MYLNVDFESALLIAAHISPSDQAAINKLSKDEIIELESIAEHICAYRHARAYREIMSQ